MRRLLLAAPLVLVAFAGCSEPDVASVEADLITPGQWDVRGDTDHVFAWAHNKGLADASITWSLTQTDGQPLPTGWNVTFSRPSATLSPDGTKITDARGRMSYPDWSTTLLTLRLPTDQAAGTFAMELHAGSAARTIEVTVHGDRAAVTGPGSRVTAAYEGRFADTGELFDDGAFPTTLGSGQTVAGFDYGLMGLARNETQTLVIPPPLGYGYDNPPGGYAKFNGRTLEFKVTIQAM